MERKYDFKLGFHGDVILKLEKDSFNLGYNYTSRFPIVPWLYYFQVSGKNQFQGLEFVAKEKTLDKELEEVLEETLSLSHRLPLSLDDFNQELGMLGIEEFYAGDNRTSYSWQLKKCNNLYLFQEDKEILQLSLEDSKRLVLDYLGFLDTEERLVIPKSDIQEIIRRLKQM